MVSGVGKTGILDKVAEKKGFAYESDRECARQRAERAKPRADQCQMAWEKDRGLAYFNQPEVERKPYGREGRSKDTTRTTEDKRGLRVLPRTERPPGHGTALSPRSHGAGLRRQPPGGPRDTGHGLVAPAPPRPPPLPEPSPAGPLLAWEPGVRSCSENTPEAPGPAPRWTPTPTPLQSRGHRRARRHTPAAEGAERSGAANPTVSSPNPRISRRGVAAARGERRSPRPERRAEGASVCGENGAAGPAGMAAAGRGRFRRASRAPAAACIPQGAGRERAPRGTGPGPRGGTKCPRPAGPGQRRVPAVEPAAPAPPPARPLPAQERKKERAAAAAAARGPTHHDPRRRRRTRRAAMRCPG